MSTNVLEKAEQRLAMIEAEAARLRAFISEFRKIASLPSNVVLMTPGTRSWYPEENEAMPLGAKIKSARMRLGWSQRRLGNEVGASQQAVDRLERGLSVHSKHLQPVIDVLRRNTQV